MTAFWHLLMLIALGFAVSVVLRGRRGLRYTTLITAWWWGVVAMSAWIATWMIDQGLSLLSPAAADHAWYGCALLAMCPPIAVLGARRPGNRVWTQFILLPMLLALGWPVLTLWVQGSELRGLQLEKPQLIIFCLIVVMGLGNYCGTRFTLTSILYGCSLLAIVTCSSEQSPSWLADRPAVRFWSVGLLAMAICLARFPSRPASRSRQDQVWFDFFDAFGVVWGRRIQDRINYLAKHENWPLRLDLDGFTDKSVAKMTESDEAKMTVVGAMTPNQTLPIRLSHEECEARLDHVLRWLLRRFVDREWLDERLRPAEGGSNARVVVDS